MDIPGVVVNMHGPFTWGADAHEAVHNSVVLEEVAKMAFNTMMLNPNIGSMDKELLDKHFLRKHVQMPTTANNTRTQGDGSFVLHRGRFFCVPKPMPRMICSLCSKTLITHNKKKSPTT